LRTIGNNFGDKIDKADKTDKTDKIDKTDKADKIDKADKTERISCCELSENLCVPCGKAPVKHVMLTISNFTIKKLLILFWFYDLLRLQNANILLKNVTLLLIWSS